MPPATGDKRPFPDGHGDAVKRAKPSVDPVAAAKAKAAEIMSKLAAKKPQSNGASPSPSPAPTRIPATPAPASGGDTKLDVMKARLAALKAGSKIDSKIEANDTARPIVPMGMHRLDLHPTSKAPAAAPVEEKQNPYFDPKPVPGVKERVSRTLMFNSQGKYLEQASKLRAQNRLEEIKRTLALQKRQAGLDENSERGFLVQPPPEKEWWDEGILDGKTYDSLDEVKVDGDDSIITIYIQHPAYMKAQQERRLIETKPLYLTPGELKKKRRARRAEELKEVQAKIRLGLMPVPEPKVKRGNMMRVLGDEAIANPSAIEMKVEAQIAQRHDDHVQANEERKLTKQQKLEKLRQQQAKSESKSLHMAVFRIDTLAYGKHRYQLDVTAKELALVGLTIFNPHQNLVIVEGSDFSITKYKKLMMNRIKWQDYNAPTEAQAEKRATEPKWMSEPKTDNRCILVFEGEIKSHAFRKWGSRMCETDGEARQVLSKSKLDSLWALAMAKGSE